MLRLIPTQIAVILSRAIKCHRLKTRNKLCTPQSLPQYVTRYKMLKRYFFLYSPTYTSRFCGSVIKQYLKVRGSPTLYILYIIYYVILLQSRRNKIMPKNWMKFHFLASWIACPLPMTIRSHTQSYFHLAFCLMLMDTCKRKILILMNTFRKKSTKTHERPNNEQ